MAYITGRNYRSATELIAEENLLQPNILITDVGTEIYLAPDYILHPEWDKKMSAEWDRQEITLLVENITTLLPQNVYSCYRLAYFVEHNDYLESVNILCQAISAANLPVQVVPSMGYIIDIIPVQAGKGSALGFIQNLLKIDNSKTIVCGDSGNDLSLFVRGTKGIVVGNARAELKKALNSCENIYFSSMNNAFGILDGLKKYGFF